MASNTTSIAAQLQLLKVHSPQLNALKPLSKVSFLFDEPKDNINEVFDIGDKGLKKLIEEDISFLEFDSLFQKSETCNRSKLTKEQNNKLNSKLKELLYHLSLYFNRKGTHEVLEWLLYRHEIHLYNREDIIVSFIPFFREKSFAKLIDLLKLEDLPKWSWLGSIKDNSNLMWLATHFLKNEDCLKTVWNVVSNVLMISEESIHPNFIMNVTKVMIEIENNSHASLSQRFLTAVLPFICEGFNNDNLNYNYCLHSILRQILRCTQLQSNILSSISTILVENFKGSKKEICLHTLIYMCTFQQNVKLTKGDCISLSKKYASMKLESTKKMPGNVRANFTMKIFETIIPMLLVEENQDQIYQVLMKMIELVNLNDSEINCLISKLFSIYKDKNKEAKKLGLELFQKIEMKYPQIVDNTIKYFRTQNNDALSQFLRDVNSKHVLKEGITVHEALNHSLESYRVKGVKALLKIIDPKVNDFSKLSLLSCLSDENPQVVSAVLKAGAKIWKLIPPLELEEAFIKLVTFRTKSTSEWFEVNKLLFKVLLEGPTTSGTLYLLLPFIIKSKTKFLDEDTTIKLNSRFYLLFKGVGCNASNYENYKLVVQNFENLEKSLKDKLAFQFIKSQSLKHKLIGAMIFCLSENSDYIADLLTIIKNSINLSQDDEDNKLNWNIDDSFETLVTVGFNQIVKNKCSDVLVFLSLNRLICHVKNLDTKFIISTSCVVPIFDALLDAQTIFRTKAFSKLILQFMFEGLKNNVLSFLTTLWLGPEFSPNNTYLRQANALNFSQNFIQNLPIKDHGCLIPHLLMPLFSLKHESRVSALKLIKKLHLEEDSPFHELGQSILENRKEIKMDKKHIIQVVKSWAFDDNAKELVAFIKLPSTSNEAKHGLLSILDAKLNPMVLSQLLPLLEIETLPSEISNLIVNKFTPSTSYLFSSKEEYIFKTFMNCLSSSKYQQIAYNKLTFKFFKKIPCKEVRHQILSYLLETHLSQKNKDSGISISLKDIVHDALEIHSFLRNVIPSNTSTPFGKPKSQRKDTTNDWEKVNIVLEILCSNPSIKNLNHILPTLLSILDTNQSSPKSQNITHLILSILSNSSIEAIANCPSFKVDLIIGVLDGPKDTIIQKLAFNLLIRLIKPLRDEMLNKVSSIFAIGLQFDNESDIDSHLLSQAIEQMVRAFLEACNTNEKEKIMSTFFRNFIDSMNTIDDRNIRIKFFSHVLQTIHAKHLWIFLVSVLDSHVNYEDTLFFIGKFLVTDELECTIKVLDLMHILISKDANSILEIFNFNQRSNEEMEEFMFKTISFLRSLFGSTHFIDRLSETETFGAELNDLYADLLAKLLKLLGLLAGRDSKFCKVFCTKLYEVLDKIISPFPSEDFLNVMSKLISSEDTLTRQKSLDMVTIKLKDSPNFFSKEDLDALFDLTNNVIDIIESGKSVSSALQTLKYLCQLSGAAEPGLQSKIINCLLDLLNVPKISSKDLIQTLECLSFAIFSLEDRIKPYLPKILPKFILISKKSLKYLNLLPVVNTLLYNLFSFYDERIYSSYLKDILIQVCLIYVELEKKNGLTNEFIEITKKLVVVVDNKSFINSITNLYQHLKKIEMGSVKLLYNLLKEKLKPMSSSTLSEFNKDIQKFFLVSLNLRNESQMNQKDIKSYEDLVIGIYAIWLSKLKKTACLSHHNELFKWADSLSRKVTFYRLNNYLVDDFKELFVSLTEIFMNDACQLMKNSLAIAHETEHKDWDEILSSIFNILQKCMLHQPTRCLDSEWFDSASECLLAQLANNFDNQELYSTRIKKHLAPSLSELINTMDDSSKPIAYKKILLTTRNESSEVKIGSIEAILCIVRKLQDQFQPLKPETEPYFLELIEDDSTQVAEYTHKAISEIENILDQKLLVDI